MELQAIFYARFHPERGPSVIEQHPPDSITTQASTAHTKRQEDEGLSGEKSGNDRSRIDGSDISAYIIPPYDLCEKTLSVCVAGGYRVLGWPISLESERYARNRFTFNVCFVLGEARQDRDGDGGEDAFAGGAEDGMAMKRWEQVVKKTALFLQALEVEDGILAAEEEKAERDGGHATVVKRLLEQCFEQLHAYSEACVRISSTHTLNLRLAPSTNPHPANPDAQPKIQPWHVPLLIRPLPPTKQWTWDLTLTRIIPYINGINHIARIAESAEVEEKLARRAVRGLLADGRARVVDLFHFQAVYALTEEWAWFVGDGGMRGECVRYVATSDPGSDDGEAAATSKQLLALYTALASSPSTHDFVLAHRSQLQHLGVDVRRFVTFGVLKGFLRRRHKYVIAVAPSSTTPPQAKTSGSSGGKVGSGSGGRRSGEDAAKDFDRAWKKAALSSGWATPPAQVSFSGSVDDGEGDPEGEGLKVSPEKPALSSRAHAEGDDEDQEGTEGMEASPEDEKLRTFLDGKHCLDEICVAMRMSETTVLEKLRSGSAKGAWGEVVVVCK